MIGFNLYMDLAAIACADGRCIDAHEFCLMAMNIAHAQCSAGKLGDMSADDRWRFAYRCARVAIPLHELGGEIAEVTHG